MDFQAVFSAVFLDHFWRNIGPEKIVEYRWLARIGEDNRLIAILSFDYFIDGLTKSVTEREG